MSCRRYLYCSFADPFCIAKAKNSADFYVLQWHNWSSRDEYPGGDCGVWTAHPLELERCRKVVRHGVSNCGACDCEQPHQFSGHSACLGGP